MVRISDLFALQEVDSEIDSAERSLADIQLRQAVGDPLEESREQLRELLTTAQEAKSLQRAAEDDVEDGRAKVSAVEEKLYSGEVTSAKELQDLQKDLESLQRQQQAREERLLAVMAAIEDAQGTAGGAGTALETSEAELRDEQERLATEAAALEAQIAALKKRRLAALRPIDASTLMLYERLRKMRAGRAVARVQRGACLGCRISLPTHILQRARSGMAVVQCSSCERILYVG
jgi:predicted  nucleic acid-binding Zn-ribbon protein